MHIDFVSATLLNLFILTFFLVKSSGFSLYIIMSSSNIDNFISSFPIQMPFISFSSQSSLSRISIIMLKRSGESGHRCLVQILAFSPFPLMIMLIVGFSYTGFIVLRYILSRIILLNILIMNRYWTLLNALSTSTFWKSLRKNNIINAVYLTSFICICASQSHCYCLSSVFAVIV